MKTDKQLYRIFRNAPQMLKDLLGIESPVPYRLRSEEFKELSRRSDGCFDCEQADIGYIIEFQGYSDQFVYHRGALERILYSQGHPDKKVYLVIVFLFPELDPKSEPWYSLHREGNPYFRVYYLRELLDALAARDPHHPLLPVFRPVLERDREQLRREAGTLHRALRTAELEPETRDVLLEAF